jgi:transposase InsO family protein
VIRRRNGLTRQDKTAPKFPDLLKRDFTASAPNTRWVGDMVRHEAPWIRVEVRDLHRRAVAAVRLKLRAV